LRSGVILIAGEPGIRFTVGQASDRVKHHDIQSSPGEVGGAGEAPDHYRLWIVHSGARHLRVTRDSAPLARRWSESPRIVVAPGTVGRRHCWCRNGGCPLHSQELARRHSRQGSRHR
jgi:hypothetical protein